MFQNEKWKEMRERIGIDGVIIIVAAIVFVSSVYALVMDQDSGTARGKDNVAVGRFEKSQNDVRRRSNTGFSWSNIRGTDTVYEGDSIFTGDQSTAAIRLESGNDLTVEPNSLVVVRTQGSDAKFDLQYGSLFGKVAKGQKLLIESQGQQQEISGDDAEIQVVSSGPSKETKVQVLKGEVKIAKVVRLSKADPAAKAKPGAKAQPVVKVEPAQILKKDEVVRFTEKGLAEVKKIEVTLLSPTTGSLHWLAPTAPLKFVWVRTGSLATSNVTLELARDAEFRDVVASRSVNANGFTLESENRPEGVLYWRVRPESENGLATLPWRVGLLPDEPPLPRSPTEGQNLVFNTDPNAKKEMGKAALFSWEDKTLSKDYELEVAQDESFSKVVYKKTVQGRLSDTSSLLPEGRYFWRVKGRHPDRTNAPWSRLTAFAVSDIAKPIPKPEFLLSDLNFNLPQKLAGKATQEKVAAKGIPAFIWKAVEGAESYEIELSKDPKFTNPTRHTVKDGTSFALSKIGAGTTYARVHSILANGVSGPTSDVAKLNVLIPAPKDLKAVEPSAEQMAKAVQMNDKHVVDIRWNSKEKPPGYELQWAADAEFRRVKRYMVKDTHFEQKMSQPLEYHMRVRAVDEKGAPISEFSEAKSYKYNPQRRVEVAAREKAKREAAEKAVVKEREAKAQAAAVAAQAQAKAEAAAKAASVESNAIANASPSASRAAKTTGSSTVSQLNEVEPASGASSSPGTSQTASVTKTRSKAEREALSTAFTTHYRTRRAGSELLREPAGATNSTLPPPVLLEPASETSLITLEGSKAFVNLSWKPISGAKKYQVQLAQDPDFENIVGDTVTTGTRTVFQKRLPEGKVYWRVRQIRDKSYSGWSDNSNINVLYE